ncbi:hypothetical protein SAMN05421787_11935 [Virgibacillus pantothenticus]|nr:hypothetical protein SAMN05421787_11935 [Virgibacillus pantothenticus]
MSEALEELSYIAALRDGKNRLFYFDKKQGKNIRSFN